MIGNFQFQTTKTATVIKTTLTAILAFISFSFIPNNMNIKKLMKSFCLEGAISQRHGEQIEEMLTEAFKERDVLLEEAQFLIEGVIEDRKYYGLSHAQESNWLFHYKKLLDKKE